MSLPEDVAEAEKIGLTYTPVWLMPLRMVRPMNMPYWLPILVDPRPTRVPKKFRPRFRSRGRLAPEAPMSYVLSVVAIRWPLVLMFQSSVLAPWKKRVYV